MTLPNVINEKVDKVASLLPSCESLLFITGAGLSADSGLPTYRGIGGLYNDKTTDEGLPIEIALSGQMMQTNPPVTWKYIYQIESSCRGAEFNRAHQVIAEMENHFPRLWVLTQNIDGFHHDAGSKNVIDIHGNIRRLFCLNCNYRTTVKDYSRLNVPPHCPHCSKIIRPDVVLFGEILPQKKCQLLAEQLRMGFDIVFSVGTTSVFPYIARPVIEAKYHGIPTVEINPGTTEVSHLVGIKIPAKAADTLDAIWTKYKNLLP